MQAAVWVTLHGDRALHFPNLPILVLLPPSKSLKVLKPVPHLLLGIIADGAGVEQNNTRVLVVVLC